MLSNVNVCNNLQRKWNTVSAACACWRVLVSRRKLVCLPESQQSRCPGHILCYCPISIPFPSCHCAASQPDSAERGQLHPDTGGFLKRLPRSFYACISVTTPGKTTPTRPSYSRVCCIWYLWQDPLSYWNKFILLVTSVILLLTHWLIIWLIIGWNLNIFDWPY